MKNILIVLSLLSFVPLAQAANLVPDQVECERLQHSSGDKVTLTRDKSDGSVVAEISGNRGWTKNLNRIFKVDFDITSIKVRFSHDGCRKKGEGAFPLLCHAGKSEVTLTGANGKPEIHASYFAMLRLSTASLDDMYDLEHRDAILARLEFATQKGHEIEISTVFKKKECF